MKRYYTSKIADMRGWRTLDRYSQHLEFNAAANHAPIGYGFSNRAAARSQTKEYNERNEQEAIRVAYFLEPHHFATMGSEPIYEPVAVYPEHPFTLVPGDMMIYRHVGQHGGVPVEYIKNECRPATRKQYLELHTEIRSISLRCNNRDLKIVDVAKCYAMMDLLQIKEN